MVFETSHTAVESRLLDIALPAQATVLEAGCGRTTRLIQRRDRIRNLVGVDLDFEAGRQNAALDSFLVADLCEQLPFADASFDVVYANFVVEHLERPDDTFREWHRVLRPGGHLVLLTTNRASPLIRAAECLPQTLRVVIKRRGPGVRTHDVFPAHYRANTPRQLSTALAGVGFAPIVVQPVATLDRYAGHHRLLAAALRGSERLLPADRRSTIVGLWAAGPAPETAPTAD